MNPPATTVFSGSLGLYIKNVKLNIPSGTAKDK